MSMEADSLNVLLNLRSPDARGLIIDLVDNKIREEYASLDRQAHREILAWEVGSCGQD